MRFLMPSQYKPTYQLNRKVLNQTIKQKKLYHLIYAEKKAYKLQHILSSAETAVSALIISIESIL